MNPITATEISPCCGAISMSTPWNALWTPTMASIGSGGKRTGKTQKVPWPACEMLHPESVIQVNHPLGGLASHLHSGQRVRSTSPVSGSKILTPLKWSMAAILKTPWPSTWIWSTGVWFQRPLVSVIAMDILSGGPGLNVTYIGMNVDSLTDATPDVLVEAMLARRTVVSTGALCDVSIDPGSVITGSAELEVEALAPSWIGVDRLHLLMNGEIIETVEGDIAIFDLVSESDPSLCGHCGRRSKHVARSLGFALGHDQRVLGRRDWRRLGAAHLAPLQTLLGWTTLVDGGTPNGNRIGTELYLTA